MKKILLSLATLALGASAVFAQSAPFISEVAFSVIPTSAVDNYDKDENMFELNTPEVTLTMEFKDYNSTEIEDLGYAPKLMIATGMGFGVDPVIYDLNSSTSTFSFTMDEEKWGQPYMGMLNAVCMVCFMNDDMDFYFTEDDEPLFYQALLTAPNTFPTKLVSVYPNNDWSEESFAEAYNSGEIRFNFSNALSLEDEPVIGEINYTRFDGVRVRAVEIELGENAEAGWNPMDGNYTITINYALDGVSANEIKKIEIYLDDLASPYGVVEVAPVVLENNNPNMKRIAKKAPAAVGLAVSNEAVSVYNVAGTLVKENIAQSEVNALPKGLYIVNGKKVVVK